MDPISGASKNFSWATLNPFREKPDQPVAGTKSTDNIPVDDPNDPQKLKDKQISGEGDDPMMQFDSLWQPNKDKDGKIIPDDEPNNSGFLPKLDNKKLDALVNKISFTDGVTGEELEAIKAGGDNATVAMFGIINKAARKAFTVSLNAASRLSEQGLQTAQGRFLSEVPNHVRNQLTDSEMSGSVGIMSNPAFEPIVNSVKQQYLKKFPKAGPKAVNAAVSQYFDYMAKEMTKKPTVDEDTPTANTKKLKAGDPNADFMQWIEQELPSATSQFGEKEVE